MYFSVIDNKIKIKIHVCFYCYVDGLYIIVLVCMSVGKEEFYLLLSELSVSRGDTMTSLGELKLEYNNDVIYLFSLICFLIFCFSHIFTFFDVSILYHLPLTYYFAKTIT